jgi:hypothetical protein
MDSAVSFLCLPSTIDSRCRTRGRTTSSTELTPRRGRGASRRHCNTCTRDSNKRRRGRHRKLPRTAAPRASPAARQRRAAAPRPAPRSTSCRRSPRARGIDEASPEGSRQNPAATPQAGNLRRGPEKRERRIRPTSGHRRTICAHRRHSPLSLVVFLRTAVSRVQSGSERFRNAYPSRGRGPFVSYCNTSIWGSSKRRGARRRTSLRRSLSPRSRPAETFAVQWLGDSRGREKDGVADAQGAQLPKKVRYDSMVPRWQYMYRVCTFANSASRGSFQL